MREDKKTIGIVREAKREKVIELNCTFDEAWPCFKKMTYGTFVVVYVKTGEVFHFETEEAPEMWKDSDVPGYVKITDRAESFEEVVAIMRKHRIVPSDGYPSEEDVKCWDEEDLKEKEEAGGRKEE